MINFLKRFGLVTFSESGRYIRLHFSFVNVIILSLFLVRCGNEAESASRLNCPVHTHIRTTVFWVGESASKDNAYIANDQSTWDGNWQQHYGGVDDPDHRNGYQPSGFTPHENPFYCALPYSDFDSSGNRKKSAANTVCWGTQKIWAPQESMCKNHWVRISFNSKTCYAQWEDAGPFGEDDFGYVFGSQRPQQSSGLDVSPAVRDFLGLDGSNFTEWQFVDSSEVSTGPWKQIITQSNVSY